jgi:hypothetical protein
MEQTSSLFSSPTEFLFNLSEDSINQQDLDCCSNPKIEYSMNQMDENVVKNIDSIPKIERYNTRFIKYKSQGFGDVKSGNVVNKKCAFRHTSIAIKSKKAKYDPFENVKYLASIKKKMAYKENFEEITKFSCSLKDS